MTTLLSDADLLARLIAFDSTSHHSNLPIADFLCDYLERPGVRIERNPNEDGSKVNLVVLAGPEVEESGDGLALSAHMDVVPAGEGWDYDPFQLSDGGDRWYGRGTADMKGFLALATNALARQDLDALDKPLGLIFTFDEELGCLGAQHLAETWDRSKPLPKNVVVGEPTSFEAVRLHKGHSKLKVTLTGVNAHSGYPHLGVNAVEPAGRVISALSKLREALAEERHETSEHFPETPYIALNIARIHGGSAVNVVPDRCVIDVGLRPLPGVESTPVLERAIAAVEEAMAQDDLGAGYEVEVTNDAPGMLLSEDAPIYRAACELTGQTETVSASYGTDGGWLRYLGLDCVIFGPGTIEVAHKPNEWLPKADFVRGAEVLQSLIQRFCRGREAWGPIPPPRFSVDR